MTHVPLKLPTGHAIPELRIVPAHDVALHEEADPGRVERLVARMRRDAVLRNPPIAAALPPDGYIVLDGANRTSALAALGAPVRLLQVVDYQDPAIRLEVWRHLIAEPLDLPAVLQGAGVVIERASSGAAARALAQREIACYFLTGAGTYTVPLSPSGPLAATLAAVVGAYKGAVRIHRVSTEDFDALAREYGDTSAVVVFPRLHKEDILEIAAAPTKLPSGITRHLIPGRALRLNLPLDILITGGEAGEKHRALRELIRQRLREDAVRHYPEGVFLFDE